MNKLQIAAGAFIVSGIALIAIQIYTMVMAHASHVAVANDILTVALGQ